MIDEFVYTLALLYRLRIEMGKTLRHRRRRGTQRNTWGYHLCIDAGKCDPDAIRSKEVIRAFVKELVDRIDMKAYGPPRIIMFGTGNKKGYTLVQLIETSNITCHFSEDTGAAYLDVFSCKAFPRNVALEIFDKYFHPQSKRVRFFHRQARM